MINTQESVRWLGILDILKRGRDSNPRPLGYEPNELPLLHPTLAPFKTLTRWKHGGLAFLDKSDELMNTKVQIFF